MYQFAQMLDFPFLDDRFLRLLAGQQDRFRRYGGRVQDSIETLAPPALAINPDSDFARVNLSVLDLTEEAHRHGAARVLR